MKHTFLRSYLAAILVTILLVIFCYYWIDAPVAYYVADHHLYEYAIFYWMQRLPEIFVVLVPVTYIALLIRWHYGYGDYRDKFALCLISAILITIAFEDQLKIIFGRYWPDTFIENNLSLLKNGAYGFNWFHNGKGYRSFPSGHTAISFTIMTVVWHYYPRLRGIAILGCAMVIIGLIGMRYHFVGDIIAGACLGWIIGDSVVRISFNDEK